MPSYANANATSPVSEATEENDVGLSLADTSSTMTKPELPLPHKHQIHVLIIGMYIL
jgi:hypothetical protein